MEEKLYPGQWSKEKAWAWHNSHAWVRGCNYLPGNCTCQFELWQEPMFEERMACMEKEMTLAESIGFNSVRIAMNFETWYADPVAYKKKVDRVLSILDKHHITAMFKFGNDCTVPKDQYEAPDITKPVETAWGYHGGVIRSPHRAGLDEGYLPIDEEDMAPKYYEWVRDIISAYKDDERVIVWNMWNEPGNTKRFNKSEKHLRKFFEIAREINPIQPLTADSWLMTFNKDVENPLSNLRDIEFLAMELSDIVSFHHYGTFEHVVSTVKALKDKYDRPLYNTEWLHRIYDNNVEQLFPLFYLENIGSYQYGLVESRAQYYEPWESLRGSNLPIDRWQHDIFRANLRPYSHKEIEIIKEFCSLADKDFENKNK